MRSVVRLCLILVCYAALFVWPTFGAHRRVLGVVAQTDRGHLDNQNAVTGTDIYSCDSLDTNDGGDMRVNVRVGASQVYLAANSSAALEDDGMTIQVLAESGTVGFSEPSTANLAVRTPAGIVRAAGAFAVVGEITYKGPNELVITAMRGDLTLDNGGELRTIPEGKSADVTFEDALSQGCRDGGGADQQQNPLNGPRKIGFIYIIPPALAIPSYILWQELTESGSKPHS
jgi:hypothetical protein